MAVAVDPANPLTRSYMAKIYGAENRGELTASQLDLAKEFDPFDPTPWLYSSLQKLQANPSAFGIFGYSFLDQNAETVQAASIGGHPPTFETISNGSYALSRPLFMYVKKAHVGVVPGIAEYLTEFTSPKAWGTDGYLASKGMIPLSDTERTTVKQAVTTLEPMKL